MPNETRIDGSGLSVLLLLLKDDMITAAERTKLTGIEAGAEVNVIASIKVNGSAVTPSGKEISLTIPTKVSDITNDSGFQTASDVSAAISTALSGITGISFEIVQSLPQTGAAGTIYLISNSGTGTNAYDEYIYLNNAWEKLGSTNVDLTGYFNTTNLPALTSNEIQSIYNTVMGA